MTTHKEQIEHTYITCDSCGRRFYPAEYPDGSQERTTCNNCHKDICRRCRIYVTTYEKIEDCDYQTLKGCKLCLEINRKDIQLQEEK